MSQGGGQQSQSYNMSGLNSAGNGYATSGYNPAQSFQPSFMSQPNYGYGNPYAQIFSNLSYQNSLQQQQMTQQQAQPSAPAASIPQTSGTTPTTSTPSQGTTQDQINQTAGLSATPVFDQSANNIAAGLPAQGQTVQPIASGLAPTASAAAPAASASAGAKYTPTAAGIKQGAYDPAHGQTGNDINMMSAQLGVTPADLVARGWFTQS